MKKYLIIGYAILLNINIATAENIKSKNLDKHMLNNVMFCVVLFNYIYDGTPKGHKIFYNYIESQTGERTIPDNKYKTLIKKRDSYLMSSNKVQNKETLCFNLIKKLSNN